MEWTILLPVTYFLILGVLLWIIWPIFIGAIFLPTPPEVVGKMLQLAEVRRGDVLYDLGSGDGRIVLEAAKRGAIAVGIEADPIRVLWSRIRVRRNHERKRLRILWGDFFKVGISDASVVSVYQGESINNRLREKFETELKPGTRVVSYSFTFEGWEAVKKHPDADIYLYNITKPLIKA